MKIQEYKNGAIFDHPMFRLFFDLTANNGWNLTAIIVYVGIVALIILAIYENRKGN